MGSYYKRQNFSTRTQYSIDLTLTTSYVSGGTQVIVGNQAVKHTEVSNAPYSSGSPRSYSTPNGRAGSVTGNLAESGSDSSWSFSFTYPGVPQYQNIWGSGGYFTRFYPDGTSIDTISISASHSLLGSATASISNIKHVYRVSFDANGGSVGTSSSDADSGSSVTLPTPSRSGYNFDGWYTASSGGSYAGAAGGSYTVNSTTTLYAQWTLAYSAPSFTNGLSIGSTVRVGENWSDSMSASNTYAALGQSGTSYSGITLLSGQSISVTGNTAYINGTIGSTSSGNYTLRVRAYGPGGTADTTQTVTVRQALPSWTDETLANGTKGSSYNSTISATDVFGWLISGLPSGLNWSGTTTVTVSGTPSVYGNYTVSASPYNSDGDYGTTKNISLTIYDSAISWSDQILTSSIVVQGESYSDSVTATGSSDITYSLASGSLPSGVSLNTSTGAITGTPASGSEGTYNFTIQAANGDSSDTITTNTLTITVESAGGYVKVWNGSSWADGEVKVYNGSSWTTATVMMYNGSSWNESFSS